MGECSGRLPGEKTCDWLGRFAGQLAEAAMVARERGDEVNALFFAIKASETLQLAKHLGFPSPEAGRLALEGSGE